MPTTDQQRLATWYFYLFVLLFSTLWISPLLHFWVIASPHYEHAHANYYLAGGLLALLACWPPKCYFRLRGFEQSGKLYAWLGVRTFRRYVTRGEWMNRWIRRRYPAYRYVGGRNDLARLVQEARSAETSHIVFMLVGLPTTIYAGVVGAYGWATYLVIANVVTNLYPIFLQRYTRGRIERMCHRFAILPVQNAKGSQNQ